MTALRFVNNYDFLLCDGGGHNHGGGKANFDVDAHDVYAEGDQPKQYRIVTQRDLRKVVLHRCSATKGGPTRLMRGDDGEVLIIDGKAEQLRIHGSVPLLETLIVVEEGTGHFVRIARSYAERMEVAEGKGDPRKLGDGYAYFDSKWIWTAGIGFNMEQDDADQEFDRVLDPKHTGLFDEVYDDQQRLSEDQMQKLLQDRESGYRDTARNAIGAPAFDALSPERQAVLEEFVSNIRNFKKSFPGMIKALKKGDVDEASEHMIRHGSHMLTDVKGSRGFNYHASMRWNVMGSPALAGGAAFQCADAGPCSGDDDTQLAGAGPAPGASSDPTGKG